MVTISKRVPHRPDAGCRACPLAAKDEHGEVDWCNAAERMLSPVRDADQAPSDCPLRKGAVLVTPEGEDDD